MGRVMALEAQGARPPKMANLRDPTNGRCGEEPSRDRP
ncbi:Hypothetical protein A7982_11242 [Minicystis rosea]|nr:Hypothetical protein A7982_11242 [Minicystis rosea]